MRKFGIVALAMVVLSGCVSVEHRPLAAGDLETMRGESITATRYAKPDFGAMTAGKASFGLIGGMAMVSAGNKIVEENGIEDPAIAISDGLMELLVAQAGMRPAESEGKVAEIDKIPALVSTYPGSRYLLDVKTFNWMFTYYPSDWSHYRVLYNARLRVIDASSRKVVAETMCSATQGDDANPPTRDQLLENDAALLKTYLKQASESCIAVLSKEVLQLSAGTAP